MVHFFGFNHTSTLPPLPISKRKLPSLPQSRSGYAHTACSDDKTRSNINTKTSIMVTPPLPHHSRMNVRKFFNKVQTKFTHNFHHPPEPPITSNHKTTSKWRPNLTFICDDEALLSALTLFMSKQYNEENILFLQSVYKLNETINDLLMYSAAQINTAKEENIDVQITSIYNKYIKHSAQKQINLSFKCFTNIMRIGQTFGQLSLTEKAQMFNVCVTEIQTLITLSILPGGFYGSEEFQSIARNRNISKNNIDTKTNQERSEVIGYDSDDIDYENENKYENKDVHFDTCSTNKCADRHNKYILSSRGFPPNSGSHEWKIEILKGSQYRLEFGVISNFDADICMDGDGICGTPSFGARCVYGYNKAKECGKMQHNFYYVSYNKDNSERCNKDLSALNIHQQPWREGDIIKIYLNLGKSSIKFFLNDKQVRKTISIQKDTTYYPVILYSDDCRFKIIS